MRMKLLSALAAVALLGTSTAAAAQATAPEPATEQVTDGSALGSDETLGAIFGLVTIALLIWLLGDDEELTPVSP